MENQSKETTNRNYLLDVLFVLKKNIIFMLVIVLLVTALGGVYAFLRKPEYIAREQINFQVQTDGSSSTANDINTMSRYVDTVIAFCTTDNVLNLAESYYVMYKQGTDDIDTFIAKEKTKIKPNVEARGKNPYFKSGNVKTYSYTKDNETTQFYFCISYQDESLQVAKDKVKILTLAYSVEVKEYFDGFTTYIADVGFDGYDIDMTKSQIIIISVVIGIVLALLLVYVKNAFDSTIKSREELERLTGASVLASIERQEDELEARKRAKKQAQKKGAK